MAPDELNENERRRNLRLDMEKELIDISWIDEDEQLCKKKIVCLDFARGGLKVSCDQAIPIHTAVNVIFKSADPSSQQLSTKVLRCNNLKNSYFEIALIFTDN
jgi:hypothetical protein